jgi:hypothetical protein
MFAVLMAAIGNAPAAGIRIVSVGGGFIVIVSGAEAVVFALSRTLIVNVNVPTTVGVPLMTPVAKLTLSPGGSGGALWE